MDIVEFVKESNRIERIYREPLHEEVQEMTRFMSLSTITINELEAFVSVYQPDAKLRDKYDMNVRIGSYYPPFGGPEIRKELEFILSADINHHHLHIKYEKLHPFTDCNGRSGRALWAHKRRNTSGGFLLNFYYDALSY